MDISEEDRVLRNIYSTPRLLKNIERGASVVEFYTRGGNRTKEYHLTPLK